MNKSKGHLIKKILPGSIAEEFELAPGDRLISINGHEIEDIFDYQFYAEDTYIEILIEKPDGEQWILEVDKEEDEDLGIEFDNGLMDEYRSCHNKCIFCFIDQMPKGMRDTLYFKDDDSRLSFLQGNYITMTNMKQADIDRIIHMLGKLRHCRHIVKLGFIRRSKETDNPFRDIVREILHTCISRSDFTSFISCAVLSFLFFGNHKPHEELACNLILASVVLNRYFYHLDFLLFLL